MGPPSQPQFSYGLQDSPFGRRQGGVHGHLKEEAAIMPHSSPPEGMASRTPLIIMDAFADDKLCRREQVLQGGKVTARNH